MCPALVRVVAAASFAALTFQLALLGNMLINYIMGVIAHQYDVGKFPVVLMACVIFLLVVTWTGISKIIKAHN